MPDVIQHKYTIETIDTFKNEKMILSKEEYPLGMLSFSGGEQANITLVCKEKDSQKSYFIKVDAYSSKKLELGDLYFKISGQDLILKAMAPNCKYTGSSSKGMNCSYDATAMYHIDVAQINAICLAEKIEYKLYGTGIEKTWGSSNSFLAQTEHNQADMKRWFSQFYNEAIDSSKYTDVAASKPKSGCFIATATFGSPYHPSISVLSAFRDSILLSSAFGRSFVRYYYHYSPAIANLISKSRVLRSLSLHCLIRPLILLVRHIFLYSKRD